ncbi:MAG TPA: DNA repair protein RecO [Candidatus Saccharimonadia bacterium]|nr:DNA repair protein RecO [Candidatus Saccharimonadia bacterium]
MPTYQTTGIVIGRTNFGEADRVIRLLTADHGKISAVAKGVRKIKSRAGGHLEPLGEVEVMLATGRNLDVITSARLLWYPHRLTGDYERLTLALALAAATDRVTEAGQPAPALYMTVRQALTALEEAAEPVILELWFRLHALNALGYRPDLGACMICGRDDPDATYAFSVIHGGIVCAGDATPLDPPMSTSHIKFWRLLLNYPYSTVAHVQGARQLAAESLGTCVSFYEHHLGPSPLSWRP